MSWTEEVKITRVTNLAGYKCNKPYQLLQFVLNNGTHASVTTGYGAKYKKGQRITVKVTVNFRYTKVELVP